MGVGVHPESHVSLNGLLVFFRSVVVIVVLPKSILCPSCALCVLTQMMLLIVSSYFCLVVFYACVEFPSGTQTINLLYVAKIIAHKLIACKLPTFS